MSLEAQIAELVAKTNSLINVFNSRKTEIDVAIANAVNAAGKFTSQRAVHVDAVLGNDTTGDGSQTKPYRTVKRAVTTVVPGSFVDIRLMADQDHLINEPDYNIIHAVVRFFTYGSTAVNARLRNTCFNPPWNANEKNQAYTIKNYNSLVMFQAVDIYTADYIDTNFTPTQISPFNSFINRSDMWGGINVVFRGKIVLGDTPFVRNSSGVCSHDVRLMMTSIERAGVNQPRAPLFETEGMPCSISASSVVIPAGSAWANDLITGIRRDATGLPRHIVSNMIL